MGSIAGYTLNAKLDAQENNMIYCGTYEKYYNTSDFSLQRFQHNENPRNGTNRNSSEATFY